MAKSRPRGEHTVPSPLHNPYPPVRQFETNELHAQQIADLRLARGPRISRRRWPLLLLTIVLIAAAAFVAIYAVTV
jgi:hypothetical protein